MAFGLNGGVPEEWIRDLPHSTHDVDPPPGELTVAVSAGPLAAPMLGRVIAMLAARAGFSLDGISEAQLVTDSLSVHVPRVIIGELSGCAPLPACDTTPLQSKRPRPRWRADLSSRAAVL